MRNVSKIGPGWWDYTTLNKDILSEVEKLTYKDIVGLSRPGFKINVFDTLESFYNAEALEYVKAWQKSTSDNPTGICGPIGPTEQLPLVAQIVNDLDINIKEGHFWAMDEWVENNQDVPISHPLSFTRTDMDLCFNRIRKELVMPMENLHFLKSDNVEEYSKSFDQINCLVMQGGQGEVKHWAFNDPVKREGKYKENPPSPEEYKKLSARVVDLHPLTIIQNARTSAFGAIHKVPSKALTVGPVETWKAEKVSIWHPGHHDSHFGIRLTTFMISKVIMDSSVPMSMLGSHPDVVFNFYRPALETIYTGLH
jgi:glucosamine-6-phosphate deaminase